MFFDCGRGRGGQLDRFLGGRHLGTGQRGRAESAIRIGKRLEETANEAVRIDSVAFNPIRMTGDRRWGRWKNLR